MLRCADWRGPSCAGVGAQVMGAVGSARKRTLMLWQAVELSRAGDAPDAATLDIARRALEPPPDAQASRRPATLSGVKCVREPLNAP